MRVLSFAFGLSLAAATAHAQGLCPALDHCVNAGHQFTKGSLFPYSEDITPSVNEPIRDIVVRKDDGWTVLQSGCVGNNYDNVLSGGNANLRLLGYLRIDDATAAPGAQFEVQFLIDGQPRGWYRRAFQGLLPQGDHFNAVVPLLARGSHRFEIQVRLDDDGSLTFGQQVTTSIGVPSNYPALSQTNKRQFVVTGRWQQASDTVVFDNDSGGFIDLMAQAYFQFDEGTPGDQISVGFSIDGQHSAHTSDVAAPPFYPDGINVFDHIAGVPPGRHTLAFWLVDRNGRRLTVSNRQIEMISFPAGTNSDRPDQPLLADAIATEPVFVSTDATDQPPFQGEISQMCGGWTKVLEYTMPPSAGGFNYTGDGFVELLGTADGRTTEADIAIEAIAWDGGESDMHWVHFSVPPGRSQIYIYADSLGWDDAGETIRLWMRTSTCNHSSGAAFTVGKRYLALKLVPVDGTSCYN
jgi:hypothetical protein